MWDIGMPILYIGCMVVKICFCDIRLVGTACTVYVYNLSPSLAHTKETLHQKNTN